MPREGQDFDYSDRTAKDPNIKVPGGDSGAEDMMDAEHEDEGNERDLEDKAHRQAQELNYQTGKLEPVADHVGEQFADDDEDDGPDDAYADDARMTPASGVADGPDRPHVGADKQSAVDNPKAPAAPKVETEPKAKREKG
jgi:hypothetical protein